MKKLKILTVLGLFLCALAAFTACGGKLDSPTDISVDENNLLTWTAVEDARSYLLDIKNVENDASEEYTSKRESYSLSKLEEGDYEIKLKAVAGASGNKDSDWSKTYYFHKNYETGCLYTLIGNKSEYEITKAGTSSGDLVIEDIYRGKPVTSIAENAFKANTRIESVVIGSNVKSIAKNAFYNCKKLKSVIIPDSVTYIGESAFQGCNSLTSVKLPENLTELNKNTFAQCKGLETVTFNEKLKTIGEAAFTTCLSLKEVVIPDTVTYVGPYAFYCNTALTSVTIGNGVETIDECAFSMDATDAKLATITFGTAGKLKTIGKTAFAMCNTLTEVNFPDGLETIGQEAFRECENLKTITIPDSVIEVGAFAFYYTKLYADALEAQEQFIYADNWVVGCPSETKIGLTKIDEYTFKDGIVGIANQVFMQCPVLEEVVLPSSILYIGEYSFFDNNKLSLFETQNDSLKVIGNNALRSCDILTAVYLGEGLETIGRNAFRDCTVLNNNSYFSIIPSTVKSIGSYAFYNTAIWNSPDESGVVYAGDWVVGFTNLKTGTVVLKDSVVGIADYAFYQCERLQTIEGLGNAKYLGYGAFYECTRLATISLPRSLEKIEDYTFYKCSSLYSLVGGENAMPAGVKSIGRSAFYKCERLSAIDISNGRVETIEPYAFYGCSSLKTLNLGDDLTSIGERAFYKCSSLEELVIPEDVETIGTRAFYKCTALKTLELGVNLTEIGECAFYNCEALEQISIPDSVKTIGAKAFYKCTAAQAVSLGNGVETIGDYAFYGLANVKELTVPASVTTIGKYAFKDWNGLTSLLLRKEVEVLGDHAFYGCKSMTVYTDVESEAAAWTTRWNSSYRPVVWGCTLSEDGTYVVSVTVKEGTVQNEKENEVITAPEREGYVFDGWATESGSREVVYQASEITTAPEGTTLYAVWTSVA